MKQNKEEAKMREAEMELEIKKLRKEHFQLNYKWDNLIENRLAQSEIMKKIKTLLAELNTPEKRK
ncbi:hypothetical protein KJ925_05775 [Patescibacteria group bacterium]|nr:hypothetical protein [Patescibacteria group bacterium]